MEADKKEAQPVIGEYKDKPVIRIPLVDNPSSDNAWHWFTFGRSKAKVRQLTDEVLRRH